MSSSASAKVIKNLDNLNDEEIALVDRFAEFLIETRRRAGARERFEAARSQWAERTAQVKWDEVDALISQAVTEVRTDA